MKFLLLLFLFSTAMAAQTLIDFSIDSSARNGKVVDDVVMGGRSTGNFEVSKDGKGKFFGKVSLENNGGFSSVRFDLEPVTVLPNSSIRIRLKGDGKTYQFRVKARKSDYYSYTRGFDTSGTWETIAIPLKTMYPSFRGRPLDLPNFDQESIVELRFLIGNKKKETFQLTLETIALVTE